MLLSTLLCTLLSGVAAAQSLQLTEEELKQYDGSDADKPIYLAINGTIFDVSVAPAFYGPGGHYNHFTGKDASRAWVTECWDTEDQLTWRMDGLEAMFMPKYLDEQMQQAADGDSDMEGAEAFGKGEMARMAKVVMEKYGKVSKKTMEKRRISDKKEAEEGVQKALAHWVGFFANNSKYKVVGSVILDEENTPPPPAICEAAMKKRPMKGGKLDDIMKMQGNMGGIFDGKPKKAAKPEEMPDFVKQAINRKAADKQPPTAAPVLDNDDAEEDLVKDEL